MEYIIPLENWLRASADDRSHAVFGVFSFVKNLECRLERKKKTRRNGPQRDVLAAVDIYTQEHKVPVLAHPRGSGGLSV